MTGQMTIYDWLYPEAFDPLRELAKKARPYWTQSRDKLEKVLATDPDRNAWTEAVKHEYSPYGAAGHYGSGNGPNSITAYDLKTREITIVYLDKTGIKRTIKRSWADFAAEVARLMMRGEYNG